MLIFTGLRHSVVLLWELPVGRNALTSDAVISEDRSRVWDCASQEPCTSRNGIYPDHILINNACQVKVKVILRPTISRLVRLGVRRPSGTRDQFFFLLEFFLQTVAVRYLVASSLTRERVCNFLLLLVPASAVSLLSALSDERSGLSFIYKRYLHYLWYSSRLYIQYIQGIVHSRLGTADYALVTSNLHNNDSLVTWTVIHMTAAKFKPLIFYVSGFALSNVANGFIFMILDDFCLLPAWFCYGYSLSQEPGLLRFHASNQLKLHLHLITITRNRNAFRIQFAESCDYYSVALVRERTIPSDRRLSTKLMPTFVDRGCHVVSVTDPYGSILGFLDRSRYFFFQVAPQLYWRGWVDPVPDGESNPEPGALTTRPQRRSTFFYITYIHSVRTSQEAQYISVL
jgi:hypothetical protein